MAEHELVAYLDHAATSPLLPEVLDAMLPYLGAQFANPSATYRAARAARRAIDDAREQVAHFARCEPDEVVFTSGGTEADNLAVVGGHAAQPGPIIISSVEHEAVLRTGHALGAVEVAVDRDGILDLARLEASLSAETSVVSVIAVQNETGVCSPLEEIEERVRRMAPGALLHTDAVQAAPFFRLGDVTAGFDAWSVSAHKIGGPKGVGALVVRRRVRDRVAPIVRGGAQERDLRAGTENVAGIVGFGVACTLAPVDGVGTGELRDRLAAGILGGVDHAEVTAHTVRRSPGILHMSFEGIAAEELLILLDDAEVASSAGSACASGALDPSHVLVAMGWSEADTRTAMRFSLGRQTTEGEIDRAIGVITAAVGRLVGGEVA